LQSFAEPAGEIYDENATEGSAKYAVVRQQTAHCSTNSMAQSVPTFDCPESAA